MQSLAQKSVMAVFPSYKDSDTRETALQKIRRAKFNSNCINKLHFKSGSIKSR